MKPHEWDMDILSFIHMKAPFSDRGSWFRTWDNIRLLPELRT